MQSHLRWTTLSFLIAILLGALVSTTSAEFSFANRIDWSPIASRVPQCVIKCAASVVPKYCSPSNIIQCGCTNQKLQGDMTSCIFKTCSLEDAYMVQEYNSDFCGVAPRNRRSDLRPIVALEAAALFTIVLRFYSRWRLVGKFDWDDWAMGATAIAYIAFVAVGNIAVMKAFGVDITLVPKEEVSLGFKLFYYTESLYFICLTLTKTCVLFFFLRVFPQPLFRKIVWCVMMMIQGIGLAILLMQIFQCKPISFVWNGWLNDKEIPQRCLDKEHLAYRAAALMITETTILILLPLPILLRLNVDMKRKIGIVIMFSLGILNLITSCIRLHSLLHFGHSINPSWEWTDPIIWSGVEVAVAVMVANLPAIRILFIRVCTYNMCCMKRLFTNHWRTPYQQTQSPTLAGTGKAWDDATAPQAQEKRSIDSTDKGRTSNVMEVEQTLELGDRICGEVITTIGVGSVVDEEQGQPTTFSKTIGLETTASANQGDIVPRTPVMPTVAEEDESDSPAFAAKWSRLADEGTNHVVTVSGDSGLGEHHEKRSPRSPRFGADCYPVRVVRSSSGLARMQKRDESNTGIHVETTTSTIIEIKSPSSPYSHAGCQSQEDTCMGKDTLKSSESDRCLNSSMGMDS